MENCIKRLPNVFPGFQYETIYGDKGWGGACFRDDLRIIGGARTSNYSRLEMTIRPYSSLHVLEITAKGTIRNKEAFNRHYYEKLEEVDDQLVVHAVVYVDRAGQKPIVIGAKGSRLKRIGQKAREELNVRLGRRLHLNPWVKVREDWADDARALAQLGLE